MSDDERSLELLSTADFRVNLGGRFLAIRSEPGGQDGPDPSRPTPVEFELAEVTEHGGTPLESFRTQFSVVFHGPLQPVLSQGTYRLENDQLGTLDLFLVPVGPDAPSAPGQAPSAMRYEAVFG